MKPVLVYGRDREVAYWVAEKLDCTGFGECRAIGVAKNGRLVAGAVYHNYRPPNIESSIASTDQKWATREVLFALFAYPFHQLGVTHLSAITDAGNQQAIAFLEKSGFKREGFHPKAHPSGDAVTYGMVEEDCKWLKQPRGIEDGKEIRTDTARCA